jgi:CTP:molybdopterin cytidylyltransferase MocA
MLAVAILAAGKGTRMKSDLPKVLQPLAGATLVERVLASCARLRPQRRLLIVGHQAERVQASLAGMADLEFVLQQPQNGTGHAVQQLLPALAGFEGELLVLNGDVPLLRPETLQELLDLHHRQAAAVTLLSSRLADPCSRTQMAASAPSLSTVTAPQSSAATTSPMRGSTCSTGPGWPTCCPGSAATTTRGSFISPIRWPCFNPLAIWRWRTLRKSSASTTACS